MKQELTGLNIVGDEVFCDNCGGQEFQARVFSDGPNFGEIAYECNCGRIVKVKNIYEPGDDMYEGEV